MNNALKCTSTKAASIEDTDEQYTPGVKDYVVETEAGTYLCDLAYSIRSTSTGTVSWVIVPTVGFVDRDSGISTDNHGTCRVTLGGYSKLVLRTDIAGGYPMGGVSARFRVTRIGD